jgi:hypothetical protein
MNNPFKAWEEIKKGISEITEIVDANFKKMNSHEREEMLFFWLDILDYIKFKAELNTKERSINE